MPQADGQVVALPDLRQARQLDGEVGQRADRHADRQPLDAHHRRQEDGRRDDGQVVEQRRDGRNRELLMAVEDAGDDRSHADQDRAQEHHPRHPDRQLRRRGVEAGGHDRDEERREDRHQQAEPGQRDQDQVDDAAGQLPCLGILATGAVALEDRDEGRGQGPGDDELEDRVGDPERGEVRVELAAGAELGADDEQAHPAQQPAGQRGNGQDQAGIDEDPADRRARSWPGRLVGLVRPSCAHRPSRRPARG
jgi:hypothetical protein